MKIAKPILLVTTPIGVVFGLHEAWRLAGPAMAVLMAVMIAVVGGLLLLTIRRGQAPRQASAARAGTPRRR